MPVSFLVIFDFDHTILDGNSDLNVPQHLGTIELLREKHKKGQQWTSIVSDCIEHFSDGEIRDALRATANVHPGTVEAFELLSSFSRDQMSICIASDANTLFIEETFRHVLPFVKLDAVHTNYFVSFGGSDDSDGRRCRVDKYESDGHDCETCKHNPQMCKGKILKELLRSTHLIDPTVIYVGDGENDFCPVAKVLRARDVCLFRKKFGLENRLRSTAGGVCCRLMGWTDGREMLDAFQHIVFASPAARLPRIVRFGAGPADSFRGITLRNRLPQLIGRLLAANDKQLSTSSKMLLQQLAVDLATNAAVMPPWPPASLPQWLLNYAPVESPCAPLWSDIPWLQGEIYLNQLLVDISKCGDPSHDIYTSEKQEALLSFLDALVLPMLADEPTTNPFHWSRFDALPLLLRNMLWGNSVDLSMFNLDQLRTNNSSSNTNRDGQEGSPAMQHAASLLLKDTLVAGNQLQALESIVRRLVEGGTSPSRFLDIVMDNAGVECCADILFGVWVVVQSNRRLTVRFHVKGQPFYVSDTNPHDVEFLLTTVAASALGLSFAMLVRSFMVEGLFVVAPHGFWTAASEIRDMPPELATHLFFSRTLCVPTGGQEGIEAPPAQQQQQTQVVVPRSGLVIFKGDLNFRRLVGDRDWDGGLSFMLDKREPDAAALELLSDAISDFWPSEVPVAALRTTKSEVSVGVPRADVARLDATDKTWRFAGKYGIAIVA